MKNKKLYIYTIDEFVKFNTNSVYILSTKYKKKLGINEFHNPGPSKIIFWESTKIYMFLFMDIIIEANYIGDITIRTNNSLDQIKQKIPYATQDDLERATHLLTIYENKDKYSLSSEEIMEYSWSKSIVETFQVLKQKVPYRIGGGF